MFNGAVEFSHLLLKEKVRPGDRVADATCGNGHDTLFLARLVGPTGRVWAFDVQQQALAATRQRLTAEGLLDRVEMVHAGHESIVAVVPEQLRAVVFNLGYLPGGDKSFITLSGTTVAALEGAADLLVPGGILVIVAYTGHPGGLEEAQAVEEWASALPRKQWRVWRCSSLNSHLDAPYLVLVEKH